MDGEASTIEEFICVRTKSIRFILLKSLKDGLRNKGESLAIFQQMPEDGFWLAPDSVVEFEKMLLMM